MQPIYTSGQRLSARDVNDIIKQKRIEQDSEYGSRNKQKHNIKSPFSLEIKYDYDKQGERIISGFALMNIQFTCMGRQNLDSYFPEEELEKQEEGTGWFDILKYCQDKGYELKDLKTIYIGISIDRGRKIPVSTMSYTLLTNIDEEQAVNDWGRWHKIRLYDVDIVDGKYIYVVNDYRYQIIIDASDDIYGAFQYELKMAGEDEGIYGHVYITQCNYRASGKEYTFSNYEEELKTPPVGGKTYYLIVPKNDVGSGYISTEEVEYAHCVKLFTVDSFGWIEKDYRAQPVIGEGGNYEMVIVQVGGEYQLQLKSGENIVSRLYLTKHSSL